MKTDTARETTRPTSISAATASKTELTQQRYIQGKDVQNIRILDAQRPRAGRLRHQERHRAGVEKDGTLYTHPTSWDVYGVIALDDLLAGSTDFTPLNFAE